MRRGAGAILVLGLVVLATGCSDVDRFVDSSASESPTPQDDDLPTCSPSDPPYTSEDYGGSEEPPDDAPEETSCQWEATDLPGSVPKCLPPYEHVPRKIAVGASFRVEIVNYMACWGLGTVVVELRQDHRTWKLGAAQAREGEDVEINVTMPTDVHTGSAEVIVKYPGEAVARNPVSIVEPG